MFPATFELFGRWLPPTERARAVARMMSGIPVGTLIGLLGSGWLVERYGWPMVFYSFGAVGLLWVILWFQQIENDPANDPRLGADERALLSTAPRTADPAERIPLRPPLL